MQQTHEQHITLRELLVAALAAYWRIVRRSPVELTEIVFGFQALYWGGLLLLPADSLGTRGILTTANEWYVGAWFVLAGVYKFMALSLDFVAPFATYRRRVRQSAAALLLFSWSVVTFHFWSLNPWGTGALNYSFFMIVQGFLFARQVAPHER